jgi:hypothetical protein
MVSPFEAGLAAGSAPSPLLPLTHGTTLSVLQAIIQAAGIGNPAELEPRPCTVFNQPLVYTFYARPAYMKSGADYVNDPAFLPIFLALDGEILDSAIMIYPFDTGRYDFYPFSAVLNRADFELTLGRVGIGRVIRTFYDDAVDYYWIRPKDMLLAHSAPHHLRGYYTMLTAAHPHPEDGRESSIEIAFDRPIPLTGNVRVALVPRVRGAVPDFGPALSALGCNNIGTYSWAARFNPRDFRNTIWERLADHLGLGF